jgi:hypothetical protein
MKLSTLKKYLSIVQKYKFVFLDMRDRVPASKRKYVVIIVLAIAASGMALDNALLATIFGIFSK